MGKSNVLSDTEESGATRAAARAELVEALYRAEYDGMVRLAFLLISSGAEAEELVQDSFVEILRRFDEIRRPGAYLRSAVVSRCRSTLRRRRIAASSPPAAPEDLPAEPGELWDALGRLTADQRTTVVLRYYAGYRPAEIARITEMPGATVRSHLRRGLATLRKELTS